MSSLKKVLASATLIAGFALAHTGSAYAADEVAFVDPSNPWYVELRAGGPIPQDFDVTGAVVGSYDPDPGFMIVGNVGKYFTPNIRADVGLSYVWGEDGNFVLAGGGGVVPHTGRVAAISIMANAYYEFADMAHGITPWVGAGVGATIFDYDNLGGAGFQYNDNDTAFTIAGHLGADYALSENVDLTGRYTLSWTSSHDVSATTAGPNPITIDDHINNTFTVGFRFKFGG